MPKPEIIQLIINLLRITERTTAHADRSVDVSTPQIGCGRDPVL